MSEALQSKGPTLFALAIACWISYNIGKDHGQTLGKLKALEDQAYKRRMDELTSFNKPKNEELK